MKKNITLFAASLVIILSSLIYLRTKRLDNKVYSISQYGCCKNAVSAAIISGESEGMYNGKKVAVPGLTFDDIPKTVLGANNQNKWIEVDLSEQRLTAWEGDGIFLTTLVSTGLPWYPTPTGEFKIWVKLRATKMEGGEGKYYYYLPNVPYVMFFENDKVARWKGYGLHGTYWHNDFGTQRSHGCVNLPTDVAERLFYWVSPELKDNPWGIRSTSENPGTRIVIHE
jgi:lipoprotein-anchoring transpeptidase ErfK/SrfK